MINPDPEPVLLRLHAYIDAFSDQIRTEEINLLGQGSDSTSHERRQFLDAFAGVSDCHQLGKSKLGLISKLRLKFHLSSMGASR